MRSMHRTVGVEEEFLLVDPACGRAVAVGGAVLTVDEHSELTGELQREQVETGTRPCRALSELGRELRRSREQARSAARAVGAELAPLATSPLPTHPTVSPGSRYRRMVERFGPTASEQLTCGCHVHVGITSEAEGVAALDRIRGWLAPLLALSTNSPFWNGADSGYASFRSQVWGRWPSAGPTELVGDPAGYRELVATMLGTQTVLDEGMLYFDARLSRHHPTIEIRVADVCREPDDAVLIAALTRALVETAVRDWQAGRPADPTRTEVLRLAAWQAARTGLDGMLLDPTTWRPAPAAEVVHRLVEHVTPALLDAGDLEPVRELLTAVLGRNSGAARQRAVLERTGELRAVVADAVAGGR
jgi:glutamate---cysteine ligase / carboxylate-amine ligase